MYETAGPALMIGYDYPITLLSSTVSFPAGGSFTAQVRDVVTDLLLTTLSTANGRIVRVNDTTMNLLIPGTESTTWTATQIVLDIVRTDSTPDQYLGVKLTLMTSVPVTRGL